LSVEHRVRVEPLPIWLDWKRLLGPGNWRCTPAGDGWIAAEAMLSALDAADLSARLRGVGIAGRALEVGVQPGLSRGLGAIKLVVPHQPSKVGLRAMQAFGWPAAQTMMTLDRLGNCVAASLPSTLYEAVRGGRIQRGEELLLVGTGAGLSLGGVILTF